ncbi:MAG: hypothetical protein WCA27_30025 [Candidatus Sulfotelmatobacter sp.]
MPPKVAAIIASQEHREQARREGQEGSRRAAWIHEEKDGGVERSRESRRHGSRIIMAAWTGPSPANSAPSTSPRDVDVIYRQASDVHGVEVMELREASRSPIKCASGFQYKLADGRVWMDARKA